MISQINVILYRFNLTYLGFLTFKIKLVATVIQHNACSKKFLVSPPHITDTFTDDVTSFNEKMSPTAANPAGPDAHMGALKNVPLSPVLYELTCS